MIKFKIFIIMSVFINTSLFAQQIYIPVGQARVKPSILAIPDTKLISEDSGSGDVKNFTRITKDTITSDLAFTNLFSIQNPSSFIEKSGAGLTLETFKLSDWQTISTEFLLKTGVTFTGDNVAYEVRIFNVPLTKQIFGKRYVAKTSEPKILAHTVANDILEALTGKPGVFFSKLVMVCDKSGVKEIWSTDFDGSNPKQLTNHRTLAFAPAWSMDNKKIAYSVYMRNARNVKNIDLYEMDLATKKSRLLSNRRGINSGAVYSPDGKSLAMTMSFLGNPEIFLLNLENLEVQRMTKSVGFDVDPAFSPDGKKLAFVSSRAGGQPHVYSLNISSGEVTRLTFAGKYNATPDWSPTGDKMVFAGYLENHFDLFLMNPDGTQLERLTKNEGNNEDPHLSSDGNYIAFSSNRSGQKNIYIISTDGLYTKRITFGLGNCTSPRWSHTATLPIQ